MPHDCGLVCGYGWALCDTIGPASAKENGKFENAAPLLEPWNQTVPSPGGGWRG